MPKAYSLDLRTKIIATMYGEWSTNRDIFLEFLQRRLCPKLEPQHKVILDNASLHSIIKTCKQNNINTFEYLQWVFTRIPNHTSNKIRELLPYHYKPSA